MILLKNLFGKQNEVKEKHNKRARYFFGSIIIIIVFLRMAQSFSYAYENEVQVYYMTEKEAQERHDQVAFKNCDIMEFEGLYIKSLLVSDHWIAISFAQNKIGVFDINGKFLYGKTFNTNGGYYLYTNAINDELVIYIVRNESFYSFDTDGNLKAIIDIAGEENYINEKPNFIERGNYYYKSNGLKSSNLSRAGTKFSKIIKRTETGEEVIFYDSKYCYAGFGLVGKMGICLIVGLILILHKRKRNLQNNSG